LGATFTVVIKDAAFQSGRRVTRIDDDQACDEVNDDQAGIVGFRGPTAREIREEATFGDRFLKSLGSDLELLDRGGVRAEGGNRSIGATSVNGSAQITLGVSNDEPNFAHGAAPFFDWRCEGDCRQPCKILRPS
jgi:hypothetical protein